MSVIYLYIFLCFFFNLIRNGFAALAMSGLLFVVCVTVLSYIIYFNILFLLVYNYPINIGKKK